MLCYNFVYDFYQAHENRRAHDVFLTDTADHIGSFFRIRRTPQIAGVKEKPSIYNSLY